MIPPPPPKKPKDKKPNTFRNLHRSDYVGVNYSHVTIDDSKNRKGIKITQEQVSEG